MPNVFDEVEAPETNVFDEVESPKKVGNVFDEVEQEPFVPTPPPFEEPTVLTPEGPVYKSQYEAQKYGTISGEPGAEFSPIPFLSPSQTEKLRVSPVGRALFGATEAERAEGGPVEKTPSVMEAAWPALMVGGGGGRVATDFTKAVHTGIGGAFATDFAIKSPEAFDAFKEAVKRGDWKAATDIGVQWGFGAALTALNLKGLHDQFRSWDRIADNASARFAEADQARQAEPDTAEPGRPGEPRTVRGTAESQAFEKARQARMDKIRREGPTPEDTALFVGLDPEPLGTTAEAVEALAAELGLTWSRPARPAPMPDTAAGRPTGAPAPRAEATTTAVLTPAEAKAQAARMQAEAVRGQGYTPPLLPPPKEPVTVPEGPMEAAPAVEPPAGPVEMGKGYSDFVESLRRVGTPEMTIADVQSLFPELQMNRETARKMIADAFGPKPVTPVTPPDAPAPAPATVEPPKKRTLTPAVRSDEDPNIKVTAEDHGTAKIKMARQHATFPTKPQNEGFLDENGNWVTRAEGADIFEQITGRRPATPDALHSEDLKEAGLVSAEPKAEVKPPTPEAKPEPPVPEKPVTVEPPAPEVTKDTPPTEANIEQIAKFFPKRLNHETGMDYGVTLTEADIPRIEQKLAEASKLKMDALVAGDFSGMFPFQAKETFYQGVLIGMTRGKYPGSGTNYQAWVEKQKAKGKPVPEEPAPPTAPAPVEPPAARSGDSGQLPGPEADKWASIINANPILKDPGFAKDVERWNKLYEMTQREGMSKDEAARFIAFWMQNPVVTPNGKVLRTIKTSEGWSAYEQPDGSWRDAPGDNYDLSWATEGDLKKSLSDAGIDITGQSFSHYEPKPVAPAPVEPPSRPSNAWVIRPPSGGKKIINIYSDIHEVIGGKVFDKNTGKLLGEIVSKVTPSEPETPPASALPPAPAAPSVRLLGENYADFLKRRIGELENSTTELSSEESSLLDSYKSQLKSIEGTAPAPAPQPETYVTPPGVEAAVSAAVEDLTPEQARLAGRVADRLVALLKRGPITKAQVNEIMSEYFGGTLSMGAFTSKDMTDVIEMAVNLYIIDEGKAGTPETTVKGAIDDILWLKALLEKVPTQTTRTLETDKMQQFSTPPPLAYVVDWVAGTTQADVVIEPSAGIGGIATFAKLSGAKVIANELSKRRRLLLIQVNVADYVLGHNAEHINALLAPDIKSGKIPRPTLAQMNPPFSQSATADIKRTEIGAKHIEEALKTLAPGGRLVAIVGEGMAADRPAFRDWWKRIARTYNVRANIGISGQEYRKYGTTFGNQIIVIDKSGPTPDGGTVVGQVEKIEDLPALLEKIRNDRPSIESGPAQPSSTPPTPQGGGGGSPEPATPSQPSPRRPSGPGGGAAGTRPPATQGPGGLQPEHPPSDVSPQLPAGQPRPEGGAPSTPAEAGKPHKPLFEGGDAGLRVEQKKAGERVLSEHGVFSEYKPSKVHVKGATPHPTPLVEPTAMAAVEPIDPTYRPHIPAEVISTGGLSDSQLENVVYAGQAHQVILPNGDRMGYFIGDGTGVGKGRQIAGIILDNWNQGRKKAVWISAKKGLVDDARRDVKALGMDPTKVIDLGKNGGRNLTDQPEGIAFAPYSSMRSNNPGLMGGSTEPGQTPQLVPVEAGGKPSRMHRLEAWLGHDFDGVIVFDEAHLAGNAMDVRGARGVQEASQAGLTVLDIQHLFPKARIVYSSATGATDVINLSYGDRLGIWGHGTPFPDKMAFFNAIQSGGLSAMEIVARDLKSLGRYMARTLSFEGVTQRHLTHSLTPDQIQIYNELCRAWQLVFTHRNETMAKTGAANNGRARGRANSSFYRSQQAFYNQLLTAMQVPSVIADMKAELAKGNSVLLQLVNTNQSILDREIAEKGAEAEEGDNDYLEDMDLSPKDILIQEVANNYPTALYEAYTDDNGNTRWRPVVDAEGNPVQDPEALERKQELLDKLSLLKAPANPLELIIDTFGVENVAEVTGRTRRVVSKLQDDGTRKRVLETNRKEADRKVEAAEYNDLKRRIMIFSDAGGTGYSYHASNKIKNQQRRSHYLLQAGWRAAQAIQGFGRSHRSDQAVAPEYIPVSTDLAGHKRFISSIMRRLSELGALTGGERKAASREMFDESNDLENPYAEATVLQFFRDLHAGAIEDIDFNQLSQKLGYVRPVFDPQTGETDWVNSLVDPATGGLYVRKIPSIQQFLNRILVLEVDEQNQVFNEFFDRLQQRIEAAKSDGSYDPGTQSLKAQAIRKLSDEVVYTHPESTAKTRLVEIEYGQQVKSIKWDDRARVDHKKPIVKFVKNVRSQRIFALKEGPPRTLENGTVVETWRRIGPAGYEIVPRRTVETEAWYGSEPNYIEMGEQEAKALWDEQFAKVPKLKMHKNTYVVGAFLPIWDRLRIQSPRIWRIKTDAGETLLGALVPEDAVEALRDRMGATGGESLTPTDVFRKVLDVGQSVSLANDWTIKRSRVAGENRIEVVGPGQGDMREFQDFIGGFIERIQYKPRFFIPTDETAGVAALEKLIRKSPVVTKRPDTPGGMMPPGPGAASPREFAERQAGAGRTPPPTNPPVTTEGTAQPTPDVVRQNRDYHLFNRINSPQWLFYFGRLGQAARAAWETLVLGEFKMRESVRRDVQTLVVDTLKALPRALRKKGGKALFDAMNGRTMDEITAEWSGRDGGEQVIAQAEKVKTRLEEIRTTIRDIKRESYHRYLMGLTKAQLADLFEQNIGGGFETEGMTKSDFADALVNQAYPDDWGIADGTYLPHLFFGQWKVTMSLPGDTEPSFVTRCQTIQEAKARIYEQVKNDPSLADAQWTIAQDTVIPADMIRLGDRRFWNLVGRMREANIDPDAIRNALRGNIGRSAGKQKWFGSLLKREGFEGYSTDYARVMTAYLNGFHRWRVLTQVNREVQPLIERVKQEGRINAAERLQALMDNLWGKPPEATRQFDAFIRTIPYIRDFIKPMALDRWSRFITQLAGVLTLRTLRFSVVNRLQPLQGLWPMVGERTLVEAKILQHSEEGRRLLDEGGVRLDPGQYAHELAGAASRRAATERFSGERSNQELAFLAMYLHARKLGIPHAQAIVYGKLRGQLLTQFTPLTVDTPEILSGPFGRILFQFKRFPIKQVELIAHMASERNVPGLARLLAAFALLGGLSYFIRQTWFTDPDKRLRLKRALDKELGKKGGDLAMYGLPGLMGADISGSITLGDEPMGRSAYEKFTRMIAGPSVTMTVDAATALSTESRKNLGGIQKTEDLLRRFPATRPLSELSALLRGDLDLRTPDGETKLRRKVSDVVMGLGSFRSANEANIALAVNGIMALAKEEQRLKNQWYAAPDKTAARKEIAAFNQMWPEAAITTDDLTRYAKYRDAAKNQTDVSKIAGKRFRRLIPPEQTGKR